MRDDDPEPFELYDSSGFFVQFIQTYMREIYGARDLPQPEPVHVGNVVDFAAYRARRATGDSE